MNELPKRPVSRILRAAEADVWTDSYTFLQAAQDEADRVRLDSERWLQEARNEAFAEARQQGDAQVIERLAQTSLQVDGYLASIETALVDLALGVVRGVLNDQDHIGLLLSFTRMALQAFRKDQQLKLFVPVKDVDPVRERLASDPLSLPALTVEANDQLVPGQALLSGPSGTVEVGLEAQLGNIRRSLLPLASERAS
jgi:type III secretion protein L